MTSEATPLIRRSLALQQTGDQQAGSERGEQAYQRPFPDDILDLRDRRLTLPAQRFGGVLEIGAKLLYFQGACGLSARQRGAAQSFDVLGQQRELGAQGFDVSLIASSS
jgi:hypothetical protein